MLEIAQIRKPIRLHNTDLHPSAAFNVHIRFISSSVRSLYIGKHKTVSAADVAFGVDEEAGSR